VTFILGHLCGKNESGINFDKLTYAGNPESLADTSSNPHYSFVRGDISDALAVADVFNNGLDAVVNFSGIRQTIEWFGRTRRGWSTRDRANIATITRSEEIFSR
jgi:hypothetical protein